MTVAVGTAGAPTRASGTAPPARPRVLVTRPAERAEELVQALAERACEAVLLPLIATRPVDPGPLAALLAPGADYDWLVVTSAAALPGLAAGLAAWQRELADLHPLRVAAVGDATAQALAAAGRPPDLVPARHDGAGLVAALGELAGRRILLPRADIAGPELPAALRAAGAVVTEVVAYRTESLAPDPALLAELTTRGVDVITFASGSAVRRFLALPQVLPLLSGARIACLGPATAEVARAAGLPVHAVAEEHSARGLARAAARLAGAAGA